MDVESACYPVMMAVGSVEPHETPQMSQVNLTMPDIVQSRQAVR
ncbi:hypothetical protein VA7868_04211 [Vibrio aerogenes CECT 7868]|uniref:Uncharacterized protein n=1 Tax=Vibrio aerogenes CECT 7868 TaxID=1216006 RepID=A0A1M6DEH0_9VIBR|nr:hypothetical protein VA7868_04211 [Vibrio aerogenes CECT 7868]